MAGPISAPVGRAELAERLRSDRRARWHYVRLPLAALALLLLAGVPPALLGAFDYLAVVPLLLVFGGVVVLFFGAWYDFGAKQVVAEIMAARAPFGPEDLDHIHRQQLTLTLCYMGAAGLYVLVAIVLATAA